MTAGIPGWLIRWGGIAWRVIAIGVVTYYAFQGLQTVSSVGIAVVAAFFMAAILWGPVRWLIDHAGLPPMAATLAVFALAIALFAAVLFFMIPSIVGSIGDLSGDLGAAFESVRDWLVDGPLGLTSAQVESFQATAVDRLSSIGGSSALGGAALVVELVAGLFLAMIVTFFILKDGRSLKKMLLERLPDGKAERVETGLYTILHTLSRYLGAMAIVGLFDASLIGIALLILGVPLVLPLSILIFFGAFFPLIGAFLSGLVAVAVAFVNGGLVDGLIVLGVITAVQQFEGDVIMPLVFGQQLQLHPVVVVLAVSIGGLAFGVVGAFLAVPFVAVAIALREKLGSDPEESYLTMARGPDE